ncbi:hypothetical protein [Aliikangiella maris]|uniref:Uncharacterized protein n=2 Tax=Aliikangiella maris TaxID=3162458 RepID=A0ABV2C045_9GAMM
MSKFRLLIFCIGVITVESLVLALLVPLFLIIFSIPNKIDSVEVIGGLFLFFMFYKSIIEIWLFLLVVINKVKRRHPKITDLLRGKFFASILMFSLLLMILYESDFRLDIFFAYAAMYIPSVVIAFYLFKEVWFKAEEWLVSKGDECSTSQRAKAITEEYPSKKVPSPDILDKSKNKYWFFLAILLFALVELFINEEVTSPIIRVLRYLLIVLSVLTLKFFYTDKQKYKKINHFIWGALLISILVDINWGLYRINGLVGLQMMEVARMNVDMGEVKYIYTDEGDYKYSRFGMLISFKDNVNDYSVNCKRNFLTGTVYCMSIKGEKSYYKFGFNKIGFFSSSNIERSSVNLQVQYKFKQESPSTVLMETFHGDKIFCKKYIEFILNNVSSVKKFCKYDNEFELVEHYEYKILEIDSAGNWVERGVSKYESNDNSPSAYFVDKRKIIYY